MLQIGDIYFFFLIFIRFKSGVRWQIYKYEALKKRTTRKTHVTLSLKRFSPTSLFKKASIFPLCSPTSTSVVWEGSVLFLSLFSSESFMRLLLHVVTEAHSPSPVVRGVETERPWRLYVCSQKWMADPASSLPDLARGRWDLRKFGQIWIFRLLQISSFMVSVCWSWWVCTAR